MRGYVVGVPSREKRTPPAWGRMVKRILEQNKLKVKDVAAAAGMSPQQFSNVTSDERLNPSLGQISRIAAAIGVDLATLFASPQTESSEAVPDGTRRTVAPDSSIIRREIIATWRDILTAALYALAEADARLDATRANPPAHESAQGDVPARHRRAVR